MIRAIIFSAILQLTISQGASAKTYECDAVDEISILGISPRAAVSIGADEDERECTFSVNGAKVSSPPQEQITEAFNRLLFQDRQIFVSQFDATGLAAMLLAAGPDETTDEVAQILSEAEPELMTCISELANRDPGFFGDQFVQEFNTFDATGVCAVLGTDGFELGPISFRFDEGDNIPVMLLFIQRESLTNLLAIPRPLQ